MKKWFKTFVIEDRQIIVMKEKINHKHDSFPAIHVRAEILTDFSCSRIAFPSDEERDRFFEKEVTEEWVTEVIADLILPF